MNLILKTSFTVTLLLVLGEGTAKTYGQRCGGDLRYMLRGEKGEIVETERVSLRRLRKITTGGEPVTYGGDQILSNIGDSIKRQRIDESGLEPDEGEERPGSIKVLWLKSGCGQRLIEVELEYKKQVMVLRFNHVPAETNFVVDSLPFREGAYEIDFKSDRSLKSLKLNREGVRGKGGKYLFRGSAQAGYLVSAENWTEAGVK